MRWIGNEDTTREASPARGHEAASSREGVFAQRLVRLGEAASLLAAKGARARAEHAQGDHEGTFSF